MTLEEFRATLRERELEELLGGRRDRGVLLYGMRGRVRRWGVRRFLPSAASSAQALRHSQIRRSVRSRFMPSSAQPHTVITFQPSSFHAFSLRLSRLTFFDHFSIQNCTLLLGIVESAQP